MASGSHRLPYLSSTDGVGRSHAEYVEGESLVNMVQADLLTRRISIDGCRDIIQFLRDHDSATRHRLEAILAIKGERASDAVNRGAQAGSHKSKRMYGPNFIR